MQCNLNQEIETFLAISLFFPQMQIEKKTSIYLRETSKTLFLEMHVSDRVFSLEAPE